MELLQLTLLFTAFAGMALAMFFRLLPALVALPLMALQTALIGGVRPTDVLELVVGQGVLRLHAACAVVMFGCMLGLLLQKTGVAENIVRKGAEFSGDSPWALSVFMLLLIAALFTTLSGLGAILMVATIVMPVLSSAGVGPITAVGIFLFGLSIGGTLNAANWAVYISVMGLDADSVRPFAMVMFTLTFLTSLVYVTVQLYKDGHDIDPWRILGRAGAVLGLAACAVFLGNFVLSPGLGGALGTAATVCLKWLTGAALLALGVAAAHRAASAAARPPGEIHFTAYFAPFVPLALILVFRINFVASFAIGLVYAYAATRGRRGLDLLIQSIFEGGAVAMPAVTLMFGIGMLLVAIMGPGGKLDAYPQGWPVLELMKPVMETLVPSSPIGYVLTFGLAAPLALYRGPLNVWGMGYGLAAVFLAAGLQPAAVMGLLMSVGQVQGISDPTNTHNVWLSSEMRVDVQQVLWNTLPYTWSIAFLGLAVSAAAYVR